MEANKFISPFRCLSLLSIIYLIPIRAVVDMNPQELQYVADHLTDEKCKDLLKVLHEKSFQAHLNKDREEKRSHGPTRPCVVQLTEWSKGPGQNETFEFLALRLKELGLTEVSNKLSKAVLDETAEELHRFFLDDPFKEMIPTKSLMLDKPESTTKLLQDVDAEDKEETFFVVMVILTTISFTFCLCVGVCLACPKVGHFVCLRACPSVCAICFETVMDGFQNLWRGTKKSADKYLFVAPPGAGGGLMV